MPASLGSLTETFQKLIHKSEANKLHYLSKNYLEAQGHVDFISPFFKALGWDMENDAGLPHHEREVKLAPSELEALEPGIAATNQEIDDLVYTLYDLTVKDREIIQKSSWEERP